jgi:rhodanese-related sulfurtransferase
LQQLLRLRIHHQRNGGILRVATKPNASGRRALLLFPVAAGALFLLARSRRPSAYDIREVGVEEAKGLWKAGALVVDTRALDKFDYRHLPGAISVPLAVLRAGIPTSFTAAKATPILVYCGDGLSIGPEATHLLNQAGYVNAVNLKQGIEGWAAAKLPVEKA